MKLRYFAWVRERIGKPEEDIDPPPGIATVADLMTWLSRRGVERFALKTDGGGHRWDSNWDPQANATSVPVPTFAAMSIKTSDRPH